MLKTIRDSTLARVCLVAAMLVGASAAIAPAATGGTVSYTSTACSSFTLSGTPPNQTLNCVTSGGGGSTPTCAPTAKPAAPAILQSTTISANCDSGPTSYVWSGGGCLGITASSCTVVKSKAVSVTYTVQAVNGMGQGNPASITVSWH